MGRTSEGIPMLKTSILAALLAASPVQAAITGLKCNADRSECVQVLSPERSLFGLVTAQGSARPGVPRVPVLVPPPGREGQQDGMTRAFYLYPPELGLAVRRDTTAQDKGAGMVDFVPLASLGRPLRAGDTFGWRMRVHVPGGGNRFGVAELMVAPMETFLYSRPAGPTSRWHEHLVPGERSSRQVTGPVFDNAWPVRLDGRMGRGYLTYQAFAHSGLGDYLAANFWTVNRDDADGEYLVDLWAYGRMVARLVFQVRQGGG